jgi:hypothetical protein
MFQSGPAQTQTTTTTESGIASIANPDTAVIIAFAIVAVVTIAAFIIIVIALQALLQGMFHYAALQSEKQKKTSLAEAFSATKERFWRLYCAIALADLKIFAWCLLLVVPGIIALLRYTLLSYVIMDEPAKETGAISAHNRVKQLTKGRLLEVFGIGAVGGIIPVVGPLLETAGNAALYRQLQIYNDKKLAKPKIHWVNYLAVALITMLVALVIAAALYAVSTSN